MYIVPRKINYFRLLGPPGKREIWFEMSKVRVIEGKFARNLKPREKSLVRVRREVQVIKGSITKMHGKNINKIKF